MRRYMHLVYRVAQNK